MMVQPYLVTAGFVLLLLVMAAAFCLWLLVKSLWLGWENMENLVEDQCCCTDTLNDG